MHNLRSWKEWSDVPPDPEATGCIEAEYVDEKGCIAHAPVWQFHYANERGSLWGHSSGDWRDGTYKTNHPQYYRWRFTGPIVPSREGQGKAILIWTFREAPGELRSLSRHGGDEDWVALLPVGMEQPSWMETGSSFGCCDVSEHQLDDGRQVYIGAHA